MLVPHLSACSLSETWRRVKLYFAIRCICTRTGLDQDFIHRILLSWFSVQFNVFNSSQRKSQWKASLKRWVLSPAQNWLQLKDGERRWSGTEFQTTGAAMKKLRLRSLVDTCYIYHPAVWSSSTFCEVYWRQPCITPYLYLMGWC